MNTLMQRENGRGRLTVRGYRTDDDRWCSLVVAHEVCSRWAPYPHGAGQLGVLLEMVEAVRVAGAIPAGVR